MKQRSRLIYLLLGSSILFGGLPVFGQAPANCEQDEARRALDFWVGEWEVVDAEGRRVGTNRIEKDQGGCLIREQWESVSGGTGQSLNYLDPAEDVWKQHWVDSSGGIVDYTGDVEDGVLRYEGRHVRPDGTVLKARVVIGPVDGGRLHHLIELSSDEGATWTDYFDGTYIPLGGQIASAPDVGSAEPMAPIAEETPDEEEGGEAVAMTAAAAGAAAEMEPEGEEVVAASEPAPEVEEPAPAARVEARPVTPTPSEPAQPQAARQGEQEGSSVKAVTRELQREEIPEEQAPELVMASPMVLEIVPADIDEYPENAAWRTEETAGFICNEVKISRVGVGRRVKSDTVQATVTARLYTGRRIRKVSLLIEAVHDGEVVASDELTNIRVGLNIPAHGKEGIDVTGELQVSSEQFEAMFAGDSRPTLRLTLSCP